LSVDAKPSIQARARCHPASPPARGQPMRVEHEYDRAGALALLAALDVHTGTVPAAATPPATGIAPFMDVMGQVMAQEPYHSAPRVRHRGQRLRSPRPGRHRPAGRGLAERHHDPHAGARILAQPSSAT
jgi:hypothetical protein